MAHAPPAPTGAHHSPHPFLFLVLFIPFGAVPGFLTVALAYELSKKGISTGDIAIVVGLSYLCLIFKWLWAPLVDTLLTRKIWYVGSTLVCGMGLWLAGRAAMGEHPSLPLISLALTISNFTSTLLAMAVESLMAASVPDNQRGRAGGWSQAGNLGGQGLGGGLSLWLIQSCGLSDAASGGVLGLLCALCCLALFWVDDSRQLLKVEGHEEAAGHLGLKAALTAIVGDLWDLLRSRVGVMALLICLLPIGSGAAQNLWSPIAGEWHASANTVAFVTGAMSGLISALGCLLGGWLCDRMDRRRPTACSASCCRSAPSAWPCARAPSRNTSSGPRPTPSSWGCATPPTAPWCWKPSAAPPPPPSSASCPRCPTHPSC